MNGTIYVTDLHVGLFPSSLRPTGGPAWPPASIPPRLRLVYDMVNRMRVCPNRNITRCNARAPGPWTSSRCTCRIRHSRSKFRQRKYASHSRFRYFLQWCSHRCSLWDCSRKCPYPIVGVCHCRSVPFGPLNLTIVICVDRPGDHRSISRLVLVL